MEEKKLYPLRFCTLEYKYVWGVEKFILADLGYRDSLVREGWLAGNTISEVMDTYMDRVVGENVFEFWGRQFPLCLRMFEVKGKMPLRVHPDDDFAAQRYDFLGKDKVWKVIKAAPGAELMIGFKEDTDASKLFGACSDNTVRNLLNVVSVKAGDCFRIAPGVPHAAFGDVLIAEIAESSPLDFCLCSWGEEISEEEFDPALSLYDALEFIDYSASAPSPLPLGAVPATLVDIPQFKLDFLPLTNPFKVKGENFDSFSLYFCLGGSAAVRIESPGQQGVDYRFGEGESILVPAECTEFILLPLASDTRLLDITVPHREEKDSYINPFVPLMPEER